MCASTDMHGWSERVHGLPGRGGEDEGDDRRGRVPTLRGHRQV